MEFDQLFKQREIEALKDEIMDKFCEINQELGYVKEICRDPSNGGDTIMTALNDASIKLNETWANLESGFQEMINALGDIIANFINTITNQKAKVDEFTENIRIK